MGGWGGRGGPPAGGGRWCCWRGGGGGGALGGRQRSLWGEGEGGGGGGVGGQGGQAPRPPPCSGRATGERGGRGGCGGVPRDTGDTWEWDGTEWKRVDTEQAPSGRSRVAMAYDPNRQAVVLFGGRLPDGQPAGDTWQWDGEKVDAARIGFSPRPGTPRHGVRAEAGYLDLSWGRLCR